MCIKHMDQERKIEKSHIQTEGNETEISLVLVSLLKNEKKEEKIKT